MPYHSISASNSLIESNVSRASFPLFGWPLSPLLLLLALQSIKKVYSRREHYFPSPIFIFVRCRENNLFFSQLISARTVLYVFFSFFKTRRKEKRSETKNETMHFKTLRGVPAVRHTAVFLNGRSPRSYQHGARYLKKKDTRAPSAGYDNCIRVLMNMEYFIFSFRCAT